MLQNLRIRFACNIDQLYCNIKSIENGVDYDIVVKLFFSWSILSNILSPFISHSCSFHIYLYMCCILVESNTKHFCQNCDKCFPVRGYIYGHLKKYMAKETVTTVPKSLFWDMEVIEYISIAKLYYVLE